MHVAFRTDSSAYIGSGHLMRCLTLANELRVHGINVSFICRELNGHLINKVETEGYPIFKLPPTYENYSSWLGVTQENDARETIAIVGSLDFDWMIVDHYALDINWENVVRNKFKKIMVIDDLENRYHNCDVLLDQNYFGKNTDTRYKKFAPKTCKRLLGPKYALLNSDYRKLIKEDLDHDGSVKQILIFFGGSDSSDETSKVLEALISEDLKKLIVDVVIGSNHPNPGKIQSLVKSRPLTTLYQNIPSLLPLMTRADLMIGAGGSTTWERMYLGIPAIVKPIAENQLKSSLALAKECFQYIPESLALNTVDEWHEAITMFINASNLIKTIAKNSKILVDGYGVQRALLAIAGQPVYKLKLQKAQSSDKELLYSWANETEARRQSFSTSKISLEEHSRWLEQKLIDPNCYMYVGKAINGMPIGVVRFQLNRETKEALIAISIDSGIRGCGYSKILLKKAIKKLLMHEHELTFIAEVLETNNPSKNLFSSLKFNEIMPRRAGSKTFGLKLNQNQVACINS